MIPGEVPDRAFDDDALPPEVVARQLQSVTHRAELIYMLLMREGIPISSQTSAALGLVHDTVLSALEQADFDRQCEEE